MLEGAAAGEQLPTADDFVAGGFRDLAAKVAGDRGVIPWMRSRPTWQREGLGLSLVAVLAALVVAAIPRADIGVYPPGRLVIAVVILGLPLVLAIRGGLRSLHRPPEATWRALAVGAMAILGPIGLALLPPAHLGDPAAVSASSSAHMACFGMGALMALPVVTCLTLSARRVGGLAAMLAMGLASGLAANLFLLGHCPITDRSHLLWGHAMLVVAYAGMAFVMWTAVARWTPQGRRPPTVGDRAKAPDADN